MRFLILVVGILSPSISYADAATEKMSEADYWHLQAIELQSRLDEVTARAFACEHVQGEIERNRQRAELAKTYKIGPNDEIKDGGVIIRRGPTKPTSGEPAKGKTKTR